MYIDENKKEKQKTYRVEKMKTILRTRGKQEDKNRKITFL